MNSREFEEMVAEYFKAQGYETTLTPYSGDWGIDVIATKGEEKLAIQAKMYGGAARKVNREAMMQLHGAKDFQHCTKAVMVTDGDIMEDALKVAEELGIEVVRFDDAPYQKKETQKKETHINHIPSHTNIMPFGEVWEKYIMPLQGETLKDERKENTIEKVDNGGITRITSTGNKRKISIEDFKKAYGLLERQRSVERDEINQITKRCSSGIVLILSQVPFIGIRKNPITIYIKEGYEQENK